MKAAEFDARFDAGEDALELADWSIDQGPERHVDIAFPESMIRSIERQAALVGVSSDSLIRLWLSERLQKDSARRS